MRTLICLIAIAMPAVAAPVPATGKSEDALATARKALDEIGDMAYQGDRSTMSSTTSRSA